MIYVTGDLHGTNEPGRHRLSTRSWPEGASLSRDDFVIVAGDFGYVWDGSRADAWWLDWLETKPWTTLFVDGNHENHRLLGTLPELTWRGGIVHEARPHVLHLMRGCVFDLGGALVLAMGGAASHDRERRVEGASWWPEEMPAAEDYARARANLAACGWSVDYVVTHEAPAALAGQLAWECARAHDEGDPLQCFLQEVDDRLSYRTWFFGHYHGDEWRDDRHRLIYRDIVPIDAARGDDAHEPI